MITVAAIRMEQFGVQFYQASLTARDVGKLVRFEVLSYGEKAQPLRSAGKGTSKVNWPALGIRTTQSPVGPPLPAYVTAAPRPSR